MQTITIGRSSTNDVTLTDMSVSRQHAQIVRSDNGRYTITDLNSRNGTFVNGQRIFGTVDLNENDFVRIGESALPWKQYFRGGYTPAATVAAGMGYVPPAQPQPQPKGANVFAILGFIFAFLVSPLGIIFSAIGLGMSSKYGGRQKGLAVAGLILSIIFTVLWIVWMVALQETMDYFDMYDPSYLF